MYRRQSKPLPLGTTFVVVLLLLAAAYQLYTRGLPDRFSPEAKKVTSTYDAAAADLALDLFRKD